ncbi:MAG TPA: hypothetical protein PK971_00605 [Saprospiraceae bacterium]|nr:hypothetical protein [Saprospiraceae bacterium]HND86791.1 hypothetical protein [Saprospiraceae bacterium]HNG89935.1 hypothetical protein [Saprospiraceae bacterium]
MRHLPLFSVFIALLFAAACKNYDGGTAVETPTTDFTVTFRSNYNGEQLVKAKKYDYNGHPLNFTLHTLFLSDIILLKGSEEVVLSDVEFLDFLPTASSTPLSVTPQRVFKNIPEGEYTGMRIGYGVKPDYNDRNISTWPAGHPLANDIEYWLGWKSFIFSKIEGSGDADNNGTDDHYLVYHCGGNAVYKTFSFTQPITVKAGGKGLEIAFDLKTLFIQDDGSFYDMVKNSFTSNDKNDVAVANAIMRQYGKATTIKQ